jgi:hypothetical protein
MGEIDYINIKYGRTRFITELSTLMLRHQAIVRD